MKHLPLSRMTELCPASHAVYLALLIMARNTGRERLQVSRETLARDSGIGKLETISKALKALSDVGLIKKRVRSRTNKRGEYTGKYIQIFMRRSPLMELSEKSGVIGQKPQNGALGTEGLQRAETPFTGLVSLKREGNGTPFESVPLPEVKEQTFSLNETVGKRTGAAPLNAIELMKRNPYAEGAR